MKTRTEISRGWMIPFLVLSLYSYYAAAQTVRGNVSEADGKAVPFVNVLLLQSKDSAMVKAVVTDTTGTYVIHNVKPGTYLLSASMVGYEKVYRANVQVVEGVPITSIPTINLSNAAVQLSEVSVTGQRPFIEQKIDRMVVNVANSIIASGSTALELLEKMPGVSVDKQNDQVQMLGKAGVIIQINGKQTYLSSEDVVSLLRGTTSENIEKIELITNPSSRFDASGNSGIINIVMKRNDKLGTNGTLTGGVGTGRYGRQRGSFQINHRGNKLNLFANYAANHNGNYFDLRTRREIIDGEKSNVAYQKTYIRTPDSGQNAKAGLEYSIAKNTTIGLNWVGFWNERREKGTAGSVFSKVDGGENYLDAQTNKRVVNNLSNQIGNFNLQHKFNGSSGVLTVDLDAGRFTRNYSNGLSTLVAISGGESYEDGLFTTMPTTINIYTAKADYTRSIAKTWTMESGVKLSNVDTDNNLTISRGSEDMLEPDPALANHFTYTERITAGYLNVSRKFSNNVEMQAGLRFEHTNSAAHSVTTETLVKRNYLDAFPSIFLSKPLSKKHTLSLSYSRRIDRPNYQNLNPGRSYIDPYLFAEGNPYLKPQYTNALQIKHTFNGNVFTSFEFSVQDPFVWTFIQPVDSLQSKRIPLNVGRTTDLTAAISFPLTITKKWTMQLSLFGIYTRYQYTFMDIPQRAEQLTARLNGTSAITLGKGWNAEFSGWVNAPAVTAIYHNPWLGALDLGLQKSIGKNLKAKVTLQDVFHTNKAISRVQAPGFYRTNNLAFDTRVFMLNITYTFGNQKMKGIQQKTGSADESRRTN